MPEQQFSFCSGLKVTNTNVESMVLVSGIVVIDI